MVHDREHCNKRPRHSFCIRGNTGQRWTVAVAPAFFLSTSLLLFAGFGTLWAQQQTKAPDSSLATPVRQADLVCTRCHQTIYDNYLRTPMANASGLATEGFTPGEFTHKPSAVHYSVELRNHEVWLTYDRGGVPEFALHGKERLDYFVGSGLRGRTYLYSIDGFWFEAPINWYTAFKSYDMRPGTGTYLQAPMFLPVQARCLYCHTSNVQPKVPGTTDRFVGLPFLHTGITCEACHGDAAAHVLSGGRAAVINPAKLEGARRDSICEQCHLESETRFEHPQRSILDFRPGDLVSDYFSYFVHEGAPKAGKGAVSQVEALMVSACKRASGDRLSCITCHNPHLRPSAEERVGYYRSKCLQCHSQPEFVRSHHPEELSCIACHMSRNTADIPHQQVTDHRILRVPSQADSVGVRLVPLLSPSASDRDLGLAYGVFARGSDFANSEALRLLESAREKGEADSIALAELGYLLKQAGKLDAASAALNESLHRDPLNVRAAMSLAEIYKVSGKIKEEIELLRNAFERDPHAVGPLLVDAQCQVGERRAAILTLERVLEFDPDSERFKARLTALRSGRGSCGQMLGRPNSIISPICLNCK